MLVDNSHCSTRIVYKLDNQSLNFVEFLHKCWTRTSIFITLPVCRLPTILRLAEP